MAEVGEQRVQVKTDWRMLIGYDRHWQQLKALHQSGRFPQTLLISGREQLGKRSFAAGVAALPYCRYENACGECGGCLAVMAGDMPDMLWVESAKSLKVEDARGLQEHLAMLPCDAYGRSSYRTVVIVDAETLTEQAMNCLLKTFEEPASRVRIIMTTSHSGWLLPTVLSRFVTWHIKPPPLATSAAWLQARLPEVADDKIRETLKACGLAPAKALAILQQRDKERGEVLRLVEQLLLQEGGGALAIAEKLVRDHKITAIHLAETCEVILNQYYRTRLGLCHGPHVANPPNLIKIREILQRVKALAGRGRITLNAQLVAEALALVH